MFRQPIVWILRPFVRPFAARIRLWVRASVDESLSVARIGELDQNMRMIATELALIRSQHQQTTNLLDDQHQTVSSSLRSIQDVNDELKLRIHSTTTTTDLLAKLLDRIQLGIDGLRIDHQRESAEQQESIANLKVGFVETATEHFGQISKAQSEQFQVTAKTVAQIEDLRVAHQKEFAAQAALIVELKKGLLEPATKCLSEIRTVQSEQLQIASLTLARTDISLQRVAIPLGPDLLMRTPEAFLLVPSEDNALVSSMWESGGRLEPGTLKLLTALLSPGDRVIDVGANIGLVTMPAARCVGASGNVIAIEPSSRVAKLLNRSVALNGLSDVVTLHQCAAGGTAGKATLNLGLPVGHSSLLPLPSSHASEEVDVVRLDDLIEAKTSIEMVKIDAEGLEPEIWRGMQRVISDNPNIIVMVEFGPEHLIRANISIDDWLDGFLAPGFTAYEIDEADGSVRPLRARNELQHIVSVNLLLIQQPISSFANLTLK